MNEAPVSLAIGICGVTVVLWWLIKGNALAWRPISREREPVKFYLTVAFFLTASLSFIWGAVTFLRP